MVAEKAPSRKGLIGITFWAPPELRAELRDLATAHTLEAGKRDEGKGRVSVQDLLQEAARDLLTKYRKKPKPKS